MIIPPNVRQLVRLALEEDLGRGDLTARAISENKMARAEILAKQNIVLAGTWLLPLIAQEAGVEVYIEWRAHEGQSVTAGTKFVSLSSTARDLIGLERTWLNFLQRMCGIATEAARVEALLAGSELKVTDTRKTLPGWRYLDKYAVKLGGLSNHRFGLDGGILVKENHIRAAGGIAAAVGELKRQVPHGLKIQVEVCDEREALEAIEVGAEALLLDNFSAEDLAVLVPRLRKKSPAILLEASGGISPQNISQYCKLGLDLASMGSLTHSVPSADLSLLFQVC